MCDRTTWRFIKQANMLSEIVSRLALDDIKPGNVTYEDMASSYNPFSDSEFVDTINKLSAEDKRWTDKLPWNYEEPTYRRGKLQKKKSVEFINNFKDNLDKTKKYWVDQLLKYKEDWSKNHSGDDINKDPIYNRLIKATKNFTPTEFFKGFKPYIPPDEHAKEKGVLSTILNAKWIGRWLKNKLLLGSLGFK